MMNDVRALCSISDPNLVQLIGAYHAPEKGQARPFISSALHDMCSCVKEFGDLNNRMSPLSHSTGS